MNGSQFVLLFQHQLPSVPELNLLELQTYISCHFLSCLQLLPRNYDFSSQNSPICTQYDCTFIVSMYHQEMQEVSTYDTMFCQCVVPSLDVENIKHSCPSDV